MIVPPQSANCKRHPAAEGTLARFLLFFQPVRRRVRRHLFDALAPTAASALHPETDRCGTPSPRAGRGGSEVQP